MTMTLLLHRQVLELHLLHVDMLSLGYTNKKIHLPPGPFRHLEFFVVSVNL